MGKKVKDPRAAFHMRDNLREKRLFSDELLSKASREGLDLDATVKKSVNRFGLIQMAWNSSRTKLHYQPPNLCQKPENKEHLPKDFYTRPSFKLMTKTAISEVPDVVGERMRQSKKQPFNQHDIPWYKRSRHNWPVNRNVASAPLQKHINSQYAHTVGFTTQGTNFFRQQPESAYISRHSMDESNLPSSIHGSTSLSPSRMNSARDPEVPGRNIYFHGNERRFVNSATFNARQTH